MGQGTYDAILDKRERKEKKRKDTVHLIASCFGREAKKIKDMKRSPAGTNQIKSRNISHAGMDFDPAAQYKRTLCPISNLHAMTNYMNRMEKGSLGGSRAPRRKSRDGNGRDG